MATTSTTLISGLRDKQADAWERMAKLYGPLVYRWCQQSGLQDHDAFDTTQEVFRAVWSSIDRFRSEKKGDTFGGWLRVITRNKVRDLLRRQQKHPVAVGGTTVMRKMSSVVADDDDSNSSVELDEGGLYKRALEMIRWEFEDQTWQAFWQVTVEQQYPADVAQSLGMTPNAVYKAKARVLRRLRDELCNDEVDEQL